ncbi:hypothetical protein SIO70_31765 [Chitinophaga sancti]|uniref:cell division protein FtsQ/DivIB n=1 Tax=Chitinophaga sancti TaxID=1004 RepID=UPI002A7533F2|nr:hypothetical protein [Chitinophaga sancti]WPQ62943.1 hypothetical protein SIO70_31765 [Chitinophaga sancti]
MQTKTRRALKRIGSVLLWTAVLTGFVILLVAAVQDKEDGKCRGIVVKLVGDENNFFIEEKDIKVLVAGDRNLNPVGKPIKEINIAALEKIVSRDPWVKTANIFVDNQRKLNIKVAQREPVARIFTLAGNTYYLDKDGERIPVSARYTARVPVFTDYPSDAAKVQKADSALTAGIMEIGNFIQSDPFWTAQVEQVVITPQREFEIIPTLGDHVILFGDGTDVTKKFNKLLAFYKEGLSKVGWNNYAKINVAYENEVVCTRRSGEELSKKLAAEDSAKLASTGDTLARIMVHGNDSVQPEATKLEASIRVVPARTTASKPRNSKDKSSGKKEPKAVYKPGRN